MDENKTLATELLHEVKASAKRWFIIAIVELCVILAIVAGFLWYITLPVEEWTETIEQDATDRSFNIINGGDFNGSPSKSYEEIYEESSQETEQKEEEIEVQGDAE